MDLYLEIISGQLLGAKYKITGSIKIGRKACEITIDDPKISSYHATIVSRGPANQLKFYLKDNNSSNGIKYNGQRTPELFLAPGVEFRLGNTRFKVIDLTPALDQPKPEVKSPPKKPAEKPQSDRQKAMDKLKSHLKIPDAQRLPPVATPPPAILPSPPPPPAPEPLETPLSWPEVLTELILSAQLRASDVVNDGLAAFNPPLKLRCVRGVQYGKNWLLGYGPRQIGPKSLDLVLNESLAPPICFEVIPTAMGGEFQTAYPDVVKYNGQSLARAILQAGDIIEVFNSQLVVDFDHARN